MGLFDFMFEDGTEEKKPKKKSGLFDFMFEKEKEDESSFANADAIDDLSETIPGKIQARKTELGTFGILLNSIDVKEFPGTQAIIKGYVDLLDRIKELESLAKSDDDTNIMLRVELERKYAEFESEYERQIPDIKNLYWLSELKKQNSNMKLDFNKDVSEISQARIDDYFKYIKTISSRQPEFNEQYRNSLIEELLVAEYRLKMLTIMKRVCQDNQNGYNPFAIASPNKKKRWEPMFLEDIQEASNQYASVCNLKNMYLKAGVLRRADFSNLDRLSDDVLNNISQDVIDDFSISDVFERRGTETLEKFVILKANLNYIKELFGKIKLGKKNEDYDDNGGR